MMRPDKKGLWLFKTAQDELRAINIDENLTTTLGDSIEQFESIFEGFEWLGQAHPPKSVSRYAMDVTKGEMFEIAKGAYVEYDDIKEFLIGGDDE